jgi:ubiquinone/menaquinone biosynthesis C-methylase UbiE
MLSGLKKSALLLIYSRKPWSIMKEKKAIQETFKELSPRYEEAMDDELHVFWGWNYQRFLDELIKRTSFRENQKILDIATGTSVIPRKIMELRIPGIHIIAQDITEKMLQHGKNKISPAHLDRSIFLACSDAMALPFPSQEFDLIVSGLASHHMNIPLMLSEMNRVLMPEGVISIIDVGSSPLWERPIMKFVAKIFAFFYFLIKETPKRAWMEASSITNLRTPEGWERELSTLGFQDIKITKLLSRYKFLPEPLAITCRKGY